MRMAADTRGSDLLGIELAGTGRHYHPAAREMLKTATRERRPSGLRELLWHPTELYPPEVLGGATVYPGAPAYEDLMVSNWARQDFPALAPAVCVQVHFSITESGDIVDVRITRPSGDSSYDRSVERAVKAASPLAPPPETYRKEFRDVEYTFSPKSLQM